MTSSCVSKSISNKFRIGFVSPHICDNFQVRKISVRFFVITQLCVTIHIRKMSDRFFVTPLLWQSDLYQTIIVAQPGLRIILSLSQIRLNMLHHINFKYISSRIGFVSANQLKLKGNLAKTRVQPTPSVGEVNLGLSKVKHSKSDPGRTQKVSQSHETNWVRLWSDTKCLTENVQLFKFNLDRTRNVAHLVALFAINYWLNALQGKLLWRDFFWNLEKCHDIFPPEMP